MKINKEWAILGSLVVLLAGYLLLRNPSKVHYKIPKLKTPAIQDVVRLEVKARDLSTVIERKDNKWLIKPQNYPANSDLVSQMISQAVKPQLDVPVSENGALSAYGLADDQRMTIRVIATNTKKKNSKNKIFEFYVGVKAPSQQHTYIQIKGNPTVYQAVGNLRQVFNRPVAMLRDKRIFDVSAKKIYHVILESQGHIEADLSQKKTTLTGTSGQNWKAVEGWNAQSKTMSDLLTSLSGLQCQNYKNDSKKSDFDGKKPLYRVKFIADKTNTLSVYQQDKQGFVATASTSPYVFVLPKWQAERLMKKRKDLVQKK